MNISDGRRVLHRTGGYAAGFAVVLGKVFAHTVDEPACMKNHLYHTYKHEPTLGHYHIVGVPIIEVYVYA